MPRLLIRLQTPFQIPHRISGVLAGAIAVVVELAAIFKEPPVTFLIVIAVLLGIYWMALWMSTDHFWSWLFGLDEPSKGWNYYTPPYEPPAPPAPRVVLPRKSFGAHHNPLGLTPGDCQGEYEQFDARTWQCTLCGLIRFEKPEGKS
jgi:hypothetical protein